MAHTQDNPDRTRRLDFENGRPVRADTDDEDEPDGGDEP